MFINARMLISSICLYCCCATTTAIAETEREAIPNLMQMSLAELMNIEIVTASRKAQPLSRTAAAAFVITQQDIQRSGATSLPEALRLAPGVEVGEISPDKWSVSIRGFSGRFFAGKLLVLIDGRSIYTPAFSGVFWEMNAPLLEDIERIEVIRGPGATLWGSNAVNGVINIITSSSKDTQGKQLKLTAGTALQAASMRIGDQVTPSTSYRAYAKATHRDSFSTEDGTDLEDSFVRYQAGMRADWQQAADEVMVSGEVLQMDKGITIDAPDVTEPTLWQRRHGTTDISNAHLLAHWKRQLSSTSDIKLQTWLNHYHRYSIEYSGNRTSANLDFQHHFKASDRHDIIWGAAYQYGEDEYQATALTVVGDTPNFNVLSGFIQDEITLIPEKLWLTVGVKAEDTQNSSLKWQPNLRLLWAVNERHTLWANVASSVRLPSVFDVGVESSLSAAAWVTLPNGNRVPMLVSVTSNPNFEPEELIAYELGYRAQLTQQLSFDLALFYNDYQKLREIGLAGVTPQGQYLLATAMLNNAAEGTTQGMELALNWRPNADWQWQLNYNLLDPDYSSSLADTERLMNLSFARLYELGSPRQQVSLYGNWQINNHVNASLWLRNIGEAPGFGGLTGSTSGVDSYTALDMRLAWFVNADLELALIGKNLLHSRQLEATDDTFRVYGQVPRSLTAMFSWRFD